MEYLNRYRFSDQRLLRFRARGTWEPDSPYQAHLCVQWVCILSQSAVSAPTPDEDIIEVLDFNADAVLGEGDPDFDPFDIFLDVGGGDY